MSATIAHVSDLHFGTAPSRVVDALLSALAADAPGLVVSSGDFTQRARPKQFLAAREFLAALDVPIVAVPGNHDIPLWDAYRRARRPFRRYRRFIGDLEPVRAAGGALAIGVSTASPRRRAEGRIEATQLDRLGRVLARAREGDLRLLVTHHPLVPYPGERRFRHVVRGDAAVAAAARGQVDVLLSGHTHHARGGASWSHAAAGRLIVVSRGGTASSGRLRGEPNAYTAITARDDRLDLELRAWDGTAFVAANRTSWMRRATGWSPLRED
jgi:3',5'-cyclic AMP phosphodiesterase CpdA